MILKLNYGMSVFLLPSAVEDAGIYQWVAKRFEGKKLYLEFQTIQHGSTMYAPALLIKLADPEEEE